MEYIELLFNSKKREDLLKKYILIEYQCIKNEDDKKIFDKLFLKMNIKKVD
tara:strand:+ start:66 stop:218 length:153 start_codon:yes stop_codon:yes gene_type:complete